MSRPAPMFQGTTSQSLNSCIFVNSSKRPQCLPSSRSKPSSCDIEIPLWHSTAGSSSEDAITMLFICLICLAKPDSEIHLVRSFLFSQLFEGLTASSHSRSNRMTKDSLLTKSQHDPREDCSKAILVAGSTNGSHLVSFNQPCYAREEM